jgi:plasmid stabilization system protein ParE
MPRRIELSGAALADFYLVFYRERPGVIEIVRVIHGRRNIPDILDEL